MRRFEHALPGLRSPGLLSSRFSRQCCGVASLHGKPMPPGNAAPPFLESSPRAATFVARVHLFGRGQDGPNLWTDALLFILLITLWGALEARSDRWFASKSVGSPSLTLPCHWHVWSLQLGSCAVAVRTAEGVVMGVEKRITSKLLEESSIEKILEVDSHIGVAMSGLIPDARTLVDHARVEAQNHRFTYDEPMRTESLTQSICDLSISFGEEENVSKMSRPFGVALLIAGVDKGVPSLYHTDPSGTYVKYDAHAIGNGSEGACNLLREKYSKSMTLAEAEALVLSVLTETMEEKLTSVNVDVASVTAEGGYNVYGKDRLVELIEAAAKERALAPEAIGDD